MVRKDEMYLHDEISHQHSTSMMTFHDPILLMKNDVMKDLSHLSAVDDYYFDFFSDFGSLPSLLLGEHSLLQQMKFFPKLEELEQLRKKYQHSYSKYQRTVAVVDLF